MKKKILVGLFLTILLTVSTSVIEASQCYYYLAEFVNSWLADSNDAHFAGKFDLITDDLINFRDYAAFTACGPAPNGGTANISGELTRTNLTNQPSPRGTSTTGSTVDVYLHSGEFIYSQNVLTIKSGRGFVFSFVVTYRSMVDYDGPVGKGWDFNYNMRLVEDGNDVILRDGTGRIDKYISNGQGDFNTPAGFYNVLDDIGQGWTLTGRYGTVFTFNSNGKLTSISDRNGNTMSLGYNVSGQLETVNDCSDRNINITYYSTGRIEKITDFKNRQVRFVYDDDGHLEHIISPTVAAYPNGKTSSFTYNPDGTMHKLIDPAGQNYLTNTYVNGKVTQQAYGVGTITISYNDPAANHVTVTDGVGNISEYIFAAAAIVPSSKIVYTNRNVDATEPASYTTQWLYNTNYELTQVVLPRANAVTYIYDEGNPNVKSRANMIEHRRKELFSVPDGPNDIVKKWEYETTFNLVKSYIEPRGAYDGADPATQARYTTTYWYDYEEAVSGDLNGDTITDQNSGNLVKVDFPTVTAASNPAQSADQPASELYCYNNYGQLISYTDPQGNVKVCEYYSSNGTPCDPNDREGYLHKDIVDPGPAPQLNLTTSYCYDIIGNITNIIDENGNTKTYTTNNYSQIEQIITPVTDTLSYTTNICYDRNGKVRRIDHQNKDKDGLIDSNNPWITTSFGYDTLNNLTSLTKEVNDVKVVTTYYAYDENTNLIQMTKPKGNIVEYVYNERGLMYSLVRAPGCPEESATVSHYDENGNLQKVDLEDGIGYKFVKVYDGFDRLCKLYKANNDIGQSHYQDYTYDRMSNLLTSTFTDVSSYGAARVLKQLEYSYDERNRNYQMLESVYDVNGDFDNTGVGCHDGIKTSLYTHRPDSLLETTTDDNGKVTTHTYDASKRVIKITDALNNHIQYLYNGKGNVVQTVEHEINQVPGEPVRETNTNFSYDKLGRLTARTCHIGNTWTTGYNSQSRKVYTADPLGNTVHYTYDTIGRLIKTVYDLRDSNGLVYDTIETTRTYDKNSNLLTKTDDNGYATTYGDPCNSNQDGYDELDRNILITYADANIERFFYDVRGNMWKSIDRNGTEVFSNYNFANLLSSRTVLPAADVLGTTWENYTYDGLERMLQGSDDDTIVNLKFNSLNQRVSDSQTYNGRTYTTTVEYDYMGNKIRMDYPTGTCVAYYEIDALNRIKRARMVGAGNLHDTYFYYEGPHRKVLAEHLNDINEPWEYDDARRISKMRVKKELNSRGNIEYWYNNAGVKIAEFDHTTVKGKVFYYDSAYRLIRERIGIMDIEAELAAPGSQASQKDYVYNLDGFGNRLTVDTYLMGVLSSTDNYTHDVMNRYILINQSSLSYDNNGNLKQDQRNGKNCRYDYRNQLVRIASQGVTEFMYDVLGRRIHVDKGGGNPPADIDIPPFGNHPVASINNLNGFMQFQLLGLFGQAFGFSNGYTGNATYIRSHNAEGSVVVVTDRYGVTSEKTEYEESGKFETTEVTDSNNTKYFGSTTWDDDEKLHIGPAGAYDDTIARWLNGKLLFGRRNQGKFCSCTLWDIYGHRPSSSSDCRCNFPMWKLNIAIFNFTAKMKNAYLEANNNYRQKHIELNVALSKAIPRFETAVQTNEATKLVRLERAIFTVATSIVSPPVGKTGAKVVDKAVSAVGKASQVSDSKGIIEDVAHAFSGDRYGQSAALARFKELKQIHTYDHLIDVARNNKAMAEGAIAEMTDRVNALKTRLQSEEECETEADCQSGYDAIDQLVDEMNTNPAPNFTTDPLTPTERGEVDPALEKGPTVDYL